MTNSSYAAKYQSYVARVERHLKRTFRRLTPRSVYDPARYVLATGGKRVRAVLVLIACDAVGGKSARALPAACAIEILHNFTLVHDDIMDHAALRRGRPTVHRKWDTNAAILAGDAMVAHAYRILLAAPPKDVHAVAECFTNGFVEVCDGQGFDKEFETTRSVTPDAYTMMITKKTGKVIAAAAEIGGVIGGASAAERRALRTYGLMLGRAFQIRDDLLDITGEEKEFGKTIGGDIREGKKTFLLIDALQKARGEDRRLLERVVRRSASDALAVRAVRRAYERLGVIETAERQVRLCTERAVDALVALPPNLSTAMLGWLAGRLVARSS